MTERLLPLRTAAAHAAVALTLVVASLGIAACFSDHSTASQSIDTTSCTAPASTAGSTVVFIRSFAFVPPEVHVRAGGSVAWVNCEPTTIPHTATAADNSWDSGALAPGAAFVRTFPLVGTVPYYCTIHPGMRATVVVE